MKEFFKNITKNRFAILVFFVLIFMLGHYLAFNSVLPTTETKDLWFYSGLFMVLFSILFIEPYYTSPKNVITNTIPLLLVLLAIKSQFTEHSYIWEILFVTFSILLASSVVPLVLENEMKGPKYWGNKIAESIKNIVVVFGRGKIIYSIIFLVFLFINTTSANGDFNKVFDTYFLWLIVLWGLILTIDPNKLNNTFSFKKESLDENALGNIIGVQSKKMFLVRLFEKRKTIKRFDVVKFKYSMQEKGEKEYLMSGMVFDTYLLNQEKWMKVLQLGTIDEKGLKDNVVYKAIDSEKNDLENTLRIKDFVGVITKGSTIGKIRFDYAERENELEEGDLLELKIGNKIIFYQVVSGYTEIDKLEFKNETGFIEGEAIQLGTWIPNKLSFQKYGWVPSVNTPIFKADTTKLSVPDFKYPDHQLGLIPKTKLPSVINLNEAVSHHMAILGVTGSGKSFIARKIITELNDNDTKVICIDFNNEFVQELEITPESIISEEVSKNIFNEIEKLNTELAEFKNKQDKNVIDTAKTQIFDYFSREIKTFLESKEKEIKIFELPEISNNRSSLDYTRYFFDTLFKLVKEYQKEDNSKKISVVLEEAHTVVPEWNFAGTSDKTSQSLVNNIGQIVLQGRKYGIGFLVIAQRTANVSKTILTQCNTVICFQAFDETGFNFLSNYIGKDLVQAMPNLPQYHAIIVGKAVKSNMPMIIDLTVEEKKNKEEVGE